MTCQYSDMNQHDALYNVSRLYPGGVPALAARMGVNSMVLYNKLRPGQNSHHVTFEQVSEVIEYCVEARVPDALQPLHAFNWRHGMIAIPLPLGEDQRDGAQLVEYVCKSVQEFGHMTSAVTGAMADGKICGRELADIEREFQELFAALAQLQSHIKTKAQAQQKRGDAND